MKNICKETKNNKNNNNHSKLLNHYQFVISKKINQIKNKRLKRKESIIEKVVKKCNKNDFCSN